MCRGREQKARELEKGNITKEKKELQMSKSRESLFIPRSEKLKGSHI